jgi:hypothetical protein
VTKSEAETRCGGVWDPRRQCFEDALNLGSVAKRRSHDDNIGGTSRAT